MSPNRAALALLVIGLILLPGPAYAIGLDSLDEPDRHRESAGYVAPSIDASKDSVLVERYAHQVSFQTEDMKYRHIAEEYQAPNQTRQALEQAIHNGTVSDTNQAVQSDIRQLHRNENFLTLSYDAFYGYSLSTTEAKMVVRTTRVNDSEIASTVRDRLIVDYETLSKAEQSTFQKIRNATESDEQYDYRPWSDEPVPEKPIVNRSGNYYAIETASHTDDINFPDGLFLGIVASGVGLVSLLGSGGVWLYGRWNK